MILGIGSSCIDVVIQVDDLFLSRNGLTKGISTNVDPGKFQKIVEETRRLPIIVPGGGAANTIRGLAKLGKKCAFLSFRGDDPYGELLAKNWQRLHVLDLTAVLPGYPTARALCLVTPDGQRTMFGAEKRNDTLTPSPDDFKNVALAHTAVHSLAGGDYLEQIMEQVSKEINTISMSLSSIELVLQHKQKILDLLDRYVDLIFINEEEIKLLFDLPPEEGCFKLQQICPIVAVTQGARGCLIGHKNTLEAFPPFPAEVVDTTGAGDLFASGFIHGFLSGYPISKCAEIGNFLGSVAVTTMGVALPEEKWEKIHVYLKSSRAFNT
jgi:sugar/nucleoside kinase (ribokinase family)